MSSAFDNSPELAHIHQLVAEGVAGVNQIILLLTPGTTGPHAGDSIDLTFSNSDVVTFQAYTTHTTQVRRAHPCTLIYMLRLICLQVFTSASDTAIQWFNDTSNKISTNLQQQSDLHTEITAAEQRGAALEADFNSKVERSKQLAEKFTQDNAQLRAAMDQLNNAQRNLQDRKDEQERIRIVSIPSAR